MKNFLLFLLLLTVVLYPIKALSQDTINITTHDHVFIHTNVKEGTNSFLGWGKFPEQNKNIRRIKMQVTLGHPDSASIAHWDYLDFINLRRVGGKSGVSENIELGRLITPYGSSFTKDWSFTWEIDVTDFSMLLRDSVEIEYVHTGYEPEKLGWSLTVNFEILTGPVIADPISIEELYKGSFPYGNEKDPIENYLKPVSVTFAGNADFGRIRIQHTGHGFGRPDYCSEFCTRWRKIIFNGEVIDKRDLWKDCGRNPLYPQGGTWIYDRGHWCPGDLQKPDVYDVKAVSKENTIDIDMMPYIDSVGEVEGKEVVTAYLIQYAAPNHQNDVIIEDIEVPTNKQNYGRRNPAVFNPVIKIKNVGSQPLRKLKIKYGTKGFKSKTYQWEGSLGFYEEETVTLPGPVDFEDGNNLFEVYLLQPNGKKDQWRYDNSMSAIFSSPKKLPLDIVVNYKTNNRPEENLLFLINEKLDTVYHRRPDQCLSDTLYADTLHLEPGIYEFELLDKGGNGLEFWAEPEHGYGYLRFHDLEGNILHHFLSDCGNGQFLAFEAVEGAVPDSTVSQNAFFIYPRRTKNKLELDAFLDKTGKLRVQFMADGDPVEVHEYKQFKKGTFEYYIGYLSKGRYVVEIYVDDKLVHKDRINRD
ncbi:peptide-N-glycosidase F-related protein [Thermophagus sp. OGC60D27]|uniref:peptide-N-glycosidase F-related protein n=1 Tax=Thermophagus sp. OGC60D27 TaxID=3458415 RepID=UPI0040377595